MNKFTYENTTRIHFGEGQIASITNDIPKDKKILVIYGGGSIKKNGVYDQVAKALERHQWGEFSGIGPNPQYETLMKAVEKIKAENFDYLLAVGGGSVVDGTKFISAAACFDGEDHWDILVKQAPITNAIPLSCVLTLPATGSETNIGGVISRGSTKLPFFSPLVRPHFAVLDPTTTLSLSPRQVSNGIADAFIHTIEQYLTYPVNGKIQDRFAEGILQTLLEEGPKALANPEDKDVRANIMWSATQALNGFIGSGVPQDWATHMIGHEITGNFGADHARSLTIVLPAVMKVKRKEKEAKLLQYGERVLGIVEGTVEQRVQKAIDQTVEFFKSIAMPTKLSDIDLGEKDIDTIISSLTAHQMVALGERGDITPDISRAILKTAL